MQIRKITKDEEFPEGVNRESLARFLHEYLKPYEDTVEDIRSGIDYALSDEPGKGGFILLADQEERLVGALVMLNTGMSGYVPENLLLFVAVDSSMRGHGIGRQLCDKAIAESEGDVTLHVDHGNPARRLYERLGFTCKYDEMRYSR